MNWTSNWPDQEGFYWFYGWRFSLSIRLDQKPELIVVKVRRCGNGVLVYIADGSFMHKEDGGKGLFAPIAMPEIPSLSAPK